MTWLVVRRVLIVFVILATGGAFLFNLMQVNTSGWNFSPLRRNFSAPKIYSKVISVTSIGTWRASNRRINLTWVTNPNYTSVTIVNPKPMYQIGDILFIEVVAKDGNRRRKLYGGDYLQAVLRDNAQTASTKGRVQDHGNGLYTVSFILSFTGNVMPQVQLIHSSEAVQLLKELREIPNKRRWSCRFKDKGEDVTTTCTILPSRTLSSSSQCDFSVLNTGRTWFCQKPNTTTCDNIKMCKSARDIVDELVTSEERQLFERPFWNTDLVTDINGTISVREADENRTVMHSFPFCKPGIPHKHPEGFWLHGKWHSLSCHVRQFSPQNVTECLTNHTVHVRGDSTCRQWVERLVKWKVVQRGAGNSLIGPYTATNHSRGIMVTFNFHTLPIQTGSWFPFRNLSESGISVEVRSMAGGPNVVLVLSLCAHFVAEPKHVYSSRMIEVKLAIQELHRKYPKTKVIVKTCNTRSHRSYRSVVQQSDWLAQQIDHEMRSILGDLNVAILDVWDMTVSQWYPHNIHPNQHVQDNELNILMSYICPEMLTNIEQ
ncbi:NXPE family member 3-like isoform X1 [Branchiostoma floridae x Branchiostoma japonicum]